FLLTEQAFAENSASTVPRSSPHIDWIQEQLWSNANGPPSPVTVEGGSKLLIHEVDSDMPCAGFYILKRSCTLFLSNLANLAYMYYTPPHMSIDHPTNRKICVIRKDISVTFTLQVHC
ncbi:Hypothetical predicted protein, partial [Pelobates cultripes]